MDALPTLNGHAHNPESNERRDDHAEVQQTTDAIRAQVKEILAGIPQLTFKQRLTIDDRTRLAQALADLEDHGLTTEQAVFQLQKELNIHPARISELKKDPELPYQKLTLIETAAMAGSLRIIEEYLPTRSEKSRVAYPDRVRKAIVVYDRYLKRQEFTNTGKILIEKGLGLSIIIRLKKEYIGQNSRAMLPDLYPPVEAEVATNDIPEPVSSIRETEGAPLEYIQAEDPTPAPSESTDQSLIPPAPESTPVQPSELETQMRAQLETGTQLIDEMSSIRQQLGEALNRLALPAIPATQEITPVTPVQAPIEHNSGDQTTVNFSGTIVTLGRGKRMVIIEG